MTTTGRTTAGRTAKYANDRRRSFHNALSCARSELEARSLRRSSPLPPLPDGIVKYPRLVTTRAVRNIGYEFGEHDLLRHRHPRVRPGPTRCGASHGPAVLENANLNDCQSSCLSLNRAR
jgi:hypothetical protein